MSRQQLVAQYTRILARWPVDRLRPENVRFQRILQKRIDGGESGAQKHAAGEISAASSLLDDTFAKRYTLSERMMKPTSDPEYYRKLAVELDEAPDRTWFQRLAKRLRGIVRFQ